MPGQYIAFLYDSSQPIAAMPAGGLPLRRAIAGFGKGIALRIHASAQIPILDLADGGILIGQVFDHSGTAISDSGQLIDSTDSTGLRDHLLGDLWGDYVAIQPLPDASGFSVLNTPSCSSTLPCLYHFEQGRGFITSHASLAIRAGLYRKEVDWNYIARFLTFPYLRTEHTALWGLLELLPGMLASVHDSGVITELAWTPWSFVRPSHRHRSFRDAATAVRDAVERGVRTLASADQRILLELSGGLDSSIVGTCLRDHGAAITCASLVAQTPGADERMYAALIANLLGTAVHEVPLSVEAARFRFADAADAVRPSVGLLQYAIDSVMEMEAAGVHSASAFSGGGGDAVFGYLRTAAPAVDAWKENGLLAGLQSVRDLATLHRCTAWQALRLTIHKAFRKPVAPYPPDRSFLAASALAAGELDHPWYQAPAGSLPGDRERIFALAGNQIFMDYVPRRASRAFRMPLLAQPVIEACLRAPSWMWISGGHNRAVARAAFADQLPAGILARRSKGTLTGYLGDIYQQQKHDMLDFLLSGNLRSQGMLDIDALQRFVSSHPPPRDRTFIRVMDLCKVENWTRQQMDGLDHLR